MYYEVLACTMWFWHGSEVFDDSVLYGRFLCYKVVLKMLCGNKIILGIIYPLEMLFRVLCLVCTSDYQITYYLPSLIPTGCAMLLNPHTFGVTRMLSFYGL